MRILFEDNHLLAVDKPANLATMGVAESEDSLLSLAKAFVKRRDGKPGNVYLGIVSRLDAPVTGVVLMAKTSKAANRLTRQFREHEVEKCYWALVSGAIRPKSGQCSDWLRKDERHRKVLLAAAGASGAQEAALEYRTLRTFPDGSWLEIQLITGRKHQIRVQLSSRGHPILGDRKYGSTRSFPNGIALHARRLVIKHPVRQTRLELVAQVPHVWRRYGVADP